MRERSRAERIALVVIASLAVVALIAGNRVFSFMCDDAYIAFRYVSSRQLGWGYTWNPPPFAPVEGYTSFAWVVLLDLVWTVTGIEPPDAVGPIQLACSLGSLALLFGLALRLPLSASYERYRVLWVGLAMAAVVSNRTFLTWTTSGLETSLWTLVVLGWTAAGLRATPASTRSLTAWTGLAALSALVRPDGLLLCAASGAGILLVGARRPRALGALLPFGVPVVHLLWRYATYGAWVPNTYTAKHVGAWPEAGWYYLRSFLLEYAVVLWPLLALVAVVQLLRRPREIALVPAITVAALVAHLAYYTFDVGGDHFEYRIYHHAVGLLAVSFAFVADRAGVPARAGLLAFTLTIAASVPIPWTHWHYTHTIVVMHQQGMPHYEIAKHFPAWIRPIPQYWDELQGWMLGRFVGLRHQSHVNYVADQRRVWPSRAVGLALPSDPGDRPVIVESGVGMPGWTLPTFAVIDGRGLNDLVVARNPPKARKDGKRLMAHDRVPPPGYVRCFRPNVKAGKDGTVRVVPRPSPLTPDEIVECETTFLRRLQDAELR